jgi:hypothetical protein
MAKKTLNSNDELHSFNDEPSVIYQEGTNIWHKDGQLHRDNDEPAIVYADGTKYWYKDGKLHRDNNEPAVIDIGIEQWFIKGIQLTKRQIELLKKINASEIQYLPWLLNEDELLNSVIEKRMSEDR